MSFSENEVGKAFKDELEKHEFLFVDKQNKSYLTRFKVYLNKHVPTHTLKFRQFWRTKKLDLKDIPPAQPEIDIILVDKLNMWHAIELKAIKKTHKGICPSYYFGLGQTLAYLSFGFDEVAMWQCFDGSTMSDKEIFSYDDALARIRNPLNQFVGKTCFRILTDKEKLRIQTEVWHNNNQTWTRTWQNGIGVYDNRIKKYTIRSVSDNPFLRPMQTHEGIFPFDPKVKAIREFLERQKTELWEKSVT